MTDCLRLEDGGTGLEWLCRSDYMRSLVACA